MRQLRDPIEEEHLDQTVRSAGYAVIVERIRDIIEQKRNDLEADMPESRTCELRGELRALRLALRVPEILRREKQVPR